MATNAVLALLDATTVKSAFENSLARLKAAPQGGGVDLDALDICVQLIPLAEQLPLDDLWDTILRRLVEEHSSTERLYKIADICLGHGPFPAARLGARIDLGFSQSEDVENARAYLKFLKCSFWLSSEHHHLVTPNSLHLLSSFIAIDELEDVAHDTLSAFFSLLRNNQKISVARPEKFGQPSGLYSLDLTRDRGLELNKSLADDSVWDKLKDLDIKRFTTKSSKIFRTWFQWISRAASDGARFPCVEHEQYWRRVRLGLVNGHADQRKYCLGIIRQSFLVTPLHIDTPTMDYAAGNTDREKYDLYTTLFETLVLHRYTGQVEASLPTLTALLGSSEGLPSRITPSMATTLLAAALDPLIQESIRKMVGRWYMDFVIENHGVLGGHINFLFEAFLPWATEGSLFTSTLTATRTETICAHGSRLSAVTAKFVTDTASKPSFVPSTNSDAQEVDIDNQHGRAVIIGVVRYIMNARGRIFQPAILYLLDGLVAGLEDRLSKDPLKSEFSRSDIDEILSLARLTGLPEISSDLHSVYCRRLCDLVAPELMSQHLPSDMSLRARYRTLEGPVDRISLPGSFDAVDGELPSLEPIFNELHATKYRCLQGPAFTPACKSLTKILGQLHVASVEPNVLYEILAAFWEEAEIRDFGRPFSVHLPPLLFHPICIQTCLATDLESTAASEGKSKLLALLGSAMIHLQKLSRGRSYIIAVLATSLRKAAFINPSIISLLPFEDFILNFINDAPSIRSEFLFEVAAAEKLQKIIPHRSYTSYYGLREWHAYTAVIDILWRFPGEQVDVAKRILDRLLDPWRAQQPPVQVKNPWKSTLQLQAILLLSDYCLTESDADIYLDSLTHALVLESWPRYRHLLEWTIARIYCRFPGRTSRIISDLEKLEDYSPIHIASLIKLGLLVAPVGSEDFAVKLMTQLNSYSASPKVQIRHEANFAFPLVFELAVTRDWKNIVDNPVFAYMNTFIRNLDKFNATPWTIRTLKLDIVKDFTVVGVFQGRYLSIESPEPELVTYEDFEKLRMDDKETHAEVPPARIELGEEPKGDSTVATPATSTSALTQSIPIQSTQTILQTKAGVDIDNLHPPSGSPEKQNQRPASVMMIASLIDNPTNLGGLSRISESFGLEAMYIDELRKAEHKDFKATSVRSEKHLAIRELKEKNVPTFLMEAKSRGYEVVGIEQTDRSGILGNGEVHSEAEKGGEIVRSQDIGTLPKKCCLVLGSEKEGISPEVLAVIDRCVEIKTVGVTRSLNVQTAGGIALYEWWREWGGKA